MRQPSDPSQVDWAGVVLRHRDGTVTAIQFRTTYEVDISGEWEEQELNFGLCTRIPPMLKVVSLTIKGNGYTLWQYGADAGKRYHETTSPIESPLRGITGRIGEIER